LKEVGLGDQYLANLGPWRKMLSEGLTTWAETDMPDSRSDCHAWGASPNFEIFRTLVGIESAAPGFRSVRIAPNIGMLKHVSAVIPHPNGEIRVDLANDGAFKADVDLPRDTAGEFVWAGTTLPLHAGRNQLSFGPAK
jgi:hypothetical protein